jgi:hypothetical protein
VRSHPTEAEAPGGADERRIGRWSAIQLLLWHLIRKAAEVRQAAVFLDTFWFLPRPHRT